MKKCSLIFFILFCFLLSSSLPAQKSIVIKSIGKHIVKESVSESGENIAKKGVRKYGSSFAEKAIAERTIRNIARKKLYASMKEQGFNSLMGYAHSNAYKKVVKSGKSLYSKQAYKLREGKNYLSNRGKKISSGRRKLSYTALENSKLLDRKALKVELTVEKKAKLLEEMNANEGLAALIHKDPEFNIKRWLNTRNHVDQRKVARTSKGRLVPNGRVYAGNTYYFNPNLNSALMARLKSNNDIVRLKNYGNLTYEDLVRLDNVYPEGVPFNKQGYPDFSKVAFKGKDGKTLRINIGKLSGDSQSDISKAETIFQNMGYKWEEGYTWHHVENTTELIRVPRQIHQLVDHAGGMSTSKL